MSVEPKFCLLCIDYRYDALATEYFNSIGRSQNYFLSTTAGSCLCIGYKKYCENNCKKNAKDKCNPQNPDMKLFKESVLKNLEISLSLKDVSEINLMNHQDCGAIKAYLSCSGYPLVLGKNNKKDIEVNTKLLEYSHNYIKKHFKKIKTIKLSLIDINGTIANYSIKDKKWHIVYEGSGRNPVGLWYGKYIE